MATRINKKIKGYQVLGNETKAAPDTQAAPTQADAPEVSEFKVIQMHEKLERPEILIGATYKIKSPLFEHALYVTINDIVLNAGTEFEMRRPFEIFINSKNMDHFQWIVGLTRVMSAVFRKGGDVTFLVEELKAVFDPRGGYFKAGGVYMPSIVAELGNIIEAHLTMIGLLKGVELSDAQKALIAEKRAAYERKGAKKKPEIGTAGEMGGAMIGEEAENYTAPQSSSSRHRPGSTESGEAAEASSDAGAFPPGAMLCGKCNTQALVLLDGCQTCLNCGYSKCG
ncbi:MAG TPA: NrdJb [Rhodanobacteraceae bacterium]|nr:NrdJb [Rhodanobacteraceae bacterium]